MAPYEILGLPSTAKREDIKKAYRRLSLRYHPDRPDGDTEKYLEIKTAYEALTKPIVSEIHHQYQHRATPSFKVFNNELYSNGDIGLYCSFNNVLWVDVNGSDTYHWTILGYTGGNFVIRKRDLIKWKYTFKLISHLSQGGTIVTTCIFEDPRTKWEKFVDKFKFW